MRATSEWQLLLVGDDDDDAKDEDDEVEEEDEAGDKDCCSLNRQHALTFTLSSASTLAACMRDFVSGSRARAPACPLARSCSLSRTERTFQHKSWVKTPNLIVFWFLCSDSKVRSFFSPQINCIFYSSGRQIIFTNRTYKWRKMVREKLKFYSKS